MFGFGKFGDDKANKASQKKEKTLSAKEKMTRYEASVFTGLLHVSGLPLADDTYCEMFVTPSKLVIEAQKQTFNVAIDQIIAAQTKTNFEIEKEITSSTGKAIAGGLLFGPVGAIIGAGTKTKKRTTVTHYLIINYTDKTGKTAVLAFNSGGPLVGGCNKISKSLTEMISVIRDGAVMDL